MCNWKPKHIWNLRASSVEANADTFVKDEEEAAKPSRAKHTPSKAMNIHTIKIIYQIHILIQFIFCAFRNEAKRKNHCVPLKRWKRKRECFRSIPNCEWREPSWRKKHIIANEIRVFFAPSINRLLFLLVIFVMICHLSAERFQFFFSTIFLRYFFVIISIVCHYPKKVLSILGGENTVLELRHCGMFVFETP